MLASKNDSMQTHNHNSMQTNKHATEGSRCSFPITSGTHCSTCPVPPCSPSHHERAHSPLPPVRSVYITHGLHSHRLMTAVPITRLFASETPVASPTNRLRDPAIYHPKPRPFPPAAACCRLVPGTAGFPAPASDSAGNSSRSPDPGPP